MKFSQLIEYNQRKNFLQKSCRNETGRLVLDFFLFFKKSLSEVKANDLRLSFNIFRQPSTCYAMKINGIKRFTFDLKICSIFIFQKTVWEQFPLHISDSFLKNKIRSVTSLPTSFSALFLKKSISLLSQKQNAFPFKFQNKIKRPPFHCERYKDQNQL